MEGESAGARVICESFPGLDQDSTTRTEPTLSDTQYRCNGLKWVTEYCVYVTTNGHSTEHGVHITITEIRLSIGTRVQMRTNITETKT